MASPYTLDNSNPIIFSHDENRQIDEFSSKINIHDSKFILSYASKLQKKIAELPDLLLKGLKDDTSSEANEIIVNLLSELMAFNSDNSVFEDPIKNRKALIKLRSEYTDISKKLSSLLSILQEQQLVFMQNLSMLKDLHKKSLIYYKKLCMFIEAGNRKLKTVKNAMIQTTDTPHTIKETFERTSLLNACSRFENRLSELEKTKVLAFMFNAQIALYEKNNLDSLKKIKEISSETVPAWKKRTKIALKLSDIVELVSDSNANLNDFNISNNSLSESISALSKTLDTNSESKIVFDELHILAKEIQQSLKT